MSGRITLREYTPTPLALSPADRHALLVDGEGKFGLSPISQPDVLQVNPNQYVGVMRLPSGLTLDLLPKVDLYNVMWMIAEVERLEGIDFARLERTVTIETFEDILEPIARVFVEQVEHLIDRGLYRAYVEVEDNLTAIRGRIDFREDLVRNVVLRHRTYCRFTEFSWDVPENQVIRQVVRKLAGWGFSRKLTVELLALDRQLEDVSLSHMTASDIDRFHYARQSEHYRPIHRFCRLFLDGFSLSEEAGDSPFDGFLMDMNVLFERFVAIKLHEQLQNQPGWRIVTQQQHALFHHQGTKIKPDLLLQDNGNNVLVADTKYKKRTGGDGTTADYYQMIAYCTVLGLNHGLLIYPRHFTDVDQRMQVIGSAIHIHELSIDLRESREAIEAGFAALSARMVGMSPVVQPFRLVGVVT